MNLINTIKSRALKLLPELIAVRRHMHQFPELSFEEHNTSKFICEQLEKYKIEFQSGIANTGIVAHIKGKNSDSKTICIRADIDALPIQETNNCEYKSKVASVMHACGHDVHTACVLGTAIILNELKDVWSGTLKIIFQPGEEKLPGGASLMIKAGALKNPDAQKIIGQHVMPTMPVGTVGFRKGMFMASADEIYVTVKGKGGHAATPHLNIDPILISSHLIVALQQTVSRNAPPHIPSVLSFGKIIGNGATNIIPDEVKIEGTFRTFNEAWRFKAHDLMKKLATELASSMGGECNFDIHVGYPFLVNDDTLTEECKQGAIEYLGKDKVEDLEIRMTAEDFAYYSQIMPSCFYRLGTSNASKNITSNIHTSTFDVDEEAISIGCGLMAYLTLKQLH